MDLLIFLRLPLSRIVVTFTKAETEVKNMLTYNLAEAGTDALYVFLYKCIKKDILAGRLVAGEKLPSKRNFARNLGISVITIENAYEQLMAEGYIFSVSKKGFYVSEWKNVGMRPQRVAKESVFQPEKEMVYFADFSSNQTDAEVFPFSVWTKTIREIMSENQQQLMANPPCGGIMELRIRIARYLQEFRGMQVKPEQIVIGAGTEYLYGLIIQLLGEGIRYGVENPGYPKIAQIYSSMKVPYEYVELDSYGITVDALEKKGIQVIHTSPSHHFPTGIVMPIGRRYELLDWAADVEGRYIIEDDYDSELRFAGQPIPTLYSIDPSDKTIYINTFTKTLCSTVRISYMVLPEVLAECFYKKLAFYSCTVSNFEQYTLARFMENGGFEKHMNRLRNYYQKKRDTIIRVFQERLDREQITITESDTGAHFLMHIRTKQTEEQLVAEAMARGIKLMPLSKYYSGNSTWCSNIFVMNYSSISLDKVEEIAERLLQIMNISV